ncbi:MAG TPA: ABC transporter ATP-binding protein [Gaiellaceae bacterium]|nr:ABC transporter ATP-binding protein [Gaiellaceae bacterium]
MEAVVVRELDVVRGTTHALREVSATVPHARVTGLLGPSGSGKTTLMRAIVGVQLVRSGAVEVLGLPAGSTELRRRVGYVTQAPSVYFDLTARENLSYFARIVDVPTSRVAEVMRMVDLEARADVVDRSLSGGERSRVSLASALLGRPELLVLDEPTVGLDPVLRRDLWNTFHRLAEEGATLLVSSHVMDEAERCDFLILLRDGLVIAEAEPDELRRRTGQSDLEDAFLALVEGR